MRKQFVEGNVYAFSRKKYKQACGFMFNRYHTWPKKINGNIVIVDNADEGHCGSHNVVPEWCVCIKEVGRYDK